MVYIRSSSSPCVSEQSNRVEQRSRPALIQDRKCIKRKDEAVLLDAALQQPLESGVVENGKSHFYQRKHVQGEGNLCVVQVTSR